MSALETGLMNWKSWASRADQRENGWESDYPEWQKLMDLARTAMTDPQLPRTELDTLDSCWAISEETEDLLEFAKANLDRCWFRLPQLCGSLRPETRWQVYEVLGEAGSRAESLLRQGLSDTDAYCRRRAAISLARLHPADSLQIHSQLANDADPNMRQVAEQFR